MLSVRLQFSGILFIIVSFFIPAPAESQIPEIQGEYYDTSQYIPAFYKDAVDYNLMIAAGNGYLAEIPKLIKRGARLSATDRNGASAIFFAVSNNQIEAVKMLIFYKADLNRTSSTGETPLLVAVKNEYVEITELLLHNGANVNYADNYDATALHYSSIYGYLLETDLLLYYNAGINNRTIEGITPLFAAVWAGNADIADLLVQNGADIEISDNEGFTPFMMAALNGDTLIMDLLLNKGADIYAVNKTGHNALTLAIMNGSAETVSYLLSKGVRWAITGNKDLNSYAVASKYRRKDLLPILQDNNVPGRVRLGIDQYSAGISTRFVSKDIYTGLNLSFKEPFLNAGFNLGFDTKILATRVTLKQNDNLFYQYWERSSLAYCGVFKDFNLSKRKLNSSSVISLSMSGGYFFVNQIKGTINIPPDRFMAIPSISFKQTWNRLSFNIGTEYIKSNYHNTAPVWLRVGFSWTTFFDDVRFHGKTIKWY